MTVLGAGLLWFGWFGFNAGSALGATGQAANALLVTNTAAGAATLTWVAASYLHRRKWSVVGAACRRCRRTRGDHAGVGLRDRRRCGHHRARSRRSAATATLLREHLRIDDALDVFAVHGVGGMFGALATGVFAVAAIGGVERRDRGQLRAGWYPGDRRRRDVPVRGLDDVRDPQARRRDPRAAGPARGGAARARRGHPRRGCLPVLTFGHRQGAVRRAVVRARGPGAWSGRVVRARGGREVRGVLRVDKGFVSWPMPGSSSQARWFRLR